MPYIVIAVACIVFLGGLWCCLHVAKRADQEMEPKKPEPRKPAHEPMDLRLPERD